MNTSFNIEILFLWQEVGIRFQPLSNESSIKWCVVEIHVIKIVITSCYYYYYYYYYCHPQFCLWVKNSIECNRANLWHAWIMVIMRFKPRTLGNYVLVVQTCMSKMVVSIQESRGSDFESHHFHRKDFIF